MQLLSGLCPAVMPNWGMSALSCTGEPVVVGVTVGEGKAVAAPPFWSTICCAPRIVNAVVVHPCIWTFVMWPVCVSVHSLNLATV